MLPVLLHVYQMNDMLVQTDQVQQGLPLQLKAVLLSPQQPGRQLGPEQVQQEMPQRVLQV